MRLPWCDYPTAAEPHRHGLQALPGNLPIADLAAASPYRSAGYKVTRASELSGKQLLEMARIMADSFARREPMLRFLRLPLRPPQPLDGYRHTDPLGTHEFGPWQFDTLFAWLIRIFFFTDPASAASAIRRRDDVMQQSLAILDPHGRVIGGAINETLSHGDPPQLRDDDPIIAAIIAGFEPILELLGTQDAESIAALRQRYSAFGDALHNGRVGHHVLVARADTLDTGDTFELVAGSIEHYRDLGFEYVITSAVNQWTGAAASVLGGVPVHFEPFLTRKRLAASHVPIDTTSSPTGYISDKDSGSMLYLIRIR